MFKACIFDLDGTLTDTLESLTYSVNETLRELNLPGITHEQCRSFVGNGARYLVERALQATGDAGLRYAEEAMEIYGRIFKQHCMYQVVPYEGIQELLAELKASGVKLSVLSNKPHLQTVDIVSSIFGEEMFECVWGQKTGVPRKPDPAAVFALVSAMNVDIAECVYVGDTEVDMKTAGAAGMVSAGVTWGFRSREVLEESGADYIVEQPLDLLKLII